MLWKEINRNKFLIGIKMINIKNAVQTFSIFHWEWVRAPEHGRSKDVFHKQRCSIHQNISTLVFSCVVKSQMSNTLK